MVLIPNFEVSPPDSSHFPAPREKMRTRTPRIGFACSEVATSMIFLQIRNLFHDDDRILADLGRLHRPLQVAPILDSVAHQKRIGMHRNGESGRQFGFGSHFKTVFIAMAG